MKLNFSYLTYYQHFFSKKSMAPFLLLDNKINLKEKKSEKTEHFYS